MGSDITLDIGRIQQFLRDFARERDWEKFHSPKNLTMALASEVGELGEIFQWLSEAESQNVMASDKCEAVRHELADLLIYVLRLGDILQVDLQDAVWRKLEMNAAKYPVALAKGTARKYTDFQRE